MGIATSGPGTFTGTVHGGQQPIAGAAIQIYAVGTTGDGSTAYPMMCNTVTTSDGSGNSSNSNANAGNQYNGLPAGSFNISGLYPCGYSPSSTAETYVVATGGNPGLSSGTPNPQIALMSAIGQYGTLSSVGNIDLNEVSTVASLAALYPYATSYTAIGSVSADASALTSAFYAVNEYVNILNGQVPGGGLPPGYYGSSTEINTLADILSICVNSPGGVSGDGSPCGKLFLATKPTGGVAATDTIGATLQVLENPAHNVVPIFNLTPAQPPFLPTLAAANSDWTLPILQIPGTPVFSPGGGGYAASQSVTISDSNGAAAIHYTTDGSTPSSSSPVYSSPIAVSVSETLKAVAIGDARVSGASGSAAYTIAATGETAAATPTFSPAGGTYATPQPITLHTPTPGATIYFTVDGSGYSSAANVYTGPFTVQGTGTVHAFAVVNGYYNSAQGSASYVSQADTVLSYNISGSLYQTGAGQTPDGIQNFTGSVSIDTTMPSASIPSASIVFSNGSNTVTMSSLSSYAGLSAPGSSSQYSISQPISGDGQSFFLVLGETVPGNVNAGFNLCIDPENLGHFHDPSTCNGETRYTGNSNFNVVATGGLTPQGTSYIFVAAPPTISPAGGTFSAVQTVSIVGITPGIPIYYTLDGSTPTMESTQYSGPITVSASETVSAIAAGNGDMNSAVTSAPFTIQ